MPNLIQKIGKIIGAPEKGALATSAVLLSLDLMGGSGLFSAAGAATGIAQSGIGKSLCEALKGAIGGYLPILFQNLETSKSAQENHTNFKLFMNATDNCLKEVRTWFLESYDLQKNLLSSQKDRSKAKRIFNEQIVDPFLTYFTEDRVAELFNENKQFNAAQFIELAFQESVNFKSPGLMDYEIDKEIIRREFCAVFRKKFLDQIRIIISKDAVLRDSYHTFLFHQIIEAMNSTKGLESQLSEVLLTLKKQSGLEFPPCSPEITDRLNALEKKTDQLLGQISGYIKAHQIPDLHYMLPLEEREEIQLGFSYRYTGYVGRQDILIHLHDFMNQTDPLKWVMVAGKAGQGKSRIAQEICDVYYKKGWHVGFWPPKADRSSFNWAQFTPGHFNGVLLVFDYIIGKEKEIKFILQRIAIRLRELQAEKANPGLVRVILLEREFSNDWLDSIAMLDHVGDKLFSPDKILKPESK
ncbi:MAG: hypothetical protein J0M30_01605 [Chitinophagales bacterium]|nr:hypothetical protein [Chitinophagales bacterium]